ncbi:HAMP domain-containing sensor histidine kinase [Neptunomonas phycophila]|uniref:sensor histidine kinase n=1 Tax=Neptunomonas phycophila TaxID=1572645 RepID=UPI0026E3058C|nr:HAMP domain-containing sensor histidine kinase [Neptunomonas phycophila]MDO6467932.1 HAMP domain-containing sensor histidine kinase [Neptunomonas phycophila]
MQEPKRFSASLILMAILLLAVSIVGSFIIYQSRVQAQIQQLEGQLTQQVYNTTKALAYEFGNIENITLLLKRRLLTQDGLLNTTPINQKHVLKEFAHFQSISPFITEITWLASDGQVQIQLNATSTQENNAPSDRYGDAFMSAARRAPTTIAPAILLNEENRYYILSTVTSTESEGLHSGLFIIRFNLTPPTQNLLSTQSERFDTFLITGAGKRKLVPPPEINSEDKHAFHFSKKYPQAWSKLTLGPAEGSFVLNNQLWQYLRRTVALREHQETFNREILTIAVASKPEVLSNIKYSQQIMIGQFAFGVLGIGLFIIYRLYKNNQSFQMLHRTLQKEKSKLETTFQALQAAHEQQNLLIEELAESQKLSSLGMMVAGVAHELNTPTGGALISVSTLQRQLHELQEAINSGLKRSDLDQYVNNAESGLQLTEHNLKQASKLIKSFKRLAVDRNSEDITEFTLDEPIQDLLTSLHSLIKNANIELITDYPAQLKLYSHPGILSQVIQNFIENAINHAFSHQTISRKTIHLCAKTEANQLIVSISDNGQGIAPHVLPTIFDPFVTTRRGEGHTGLGLHQVHQWVQKILQGSIKVKSTTNEGTEFIIAIPIRLTTNKN